MIRLQILSIAFFCFSLLAHSGYSQCNTPLNLGFTNIQTDEATITWDEVVDADFYRYRYRIAGTSIWTYADAVSPANQSVLSGLDLGTNYRWQIRSFCDGGVTNSDWSESQFFLTSGGNPCTVPDGRQSNPDFTSSDLSWNSVSAANEYRVRYRTLDANSWNYQTALDNPNPSITINNLLPNTTYRWQLRTICSDDNAPWSADNLFTTSNCVNSIAGLNTSSVGDDVATLNWDNVTPNDGYRVILTVQGSDIWDTTYTATNNFVATSLFSGTDYKWQVALVCDNTNSVISNYTNINNDDLNAFTTTGAISCPAPGGLTVGTITNTTTDLSWSSVTEAVSYEVQYRVTGSPNWLEAPSGSNSTTLTSLFSGMDYQARVRSICTAGGELVGRWTGIETFTTTGPIACEAPVNLSNGPEQAESADLTWDAVTGAVAYNVRHRPNVSGGWIVDGTSTNSITLTNLFQDRTYIYGIRAICNSDTTLISRASIQENFTTGGISSCEDPTGLDESSVASTEATLVWSDVSGANNYTIRYRNGSGSWLYTSSVGASVDISGLLEGVTYSWQVRANCSSESQLTSNWVANIFTTTGVSPCPAPSNLSETGLASTQVTLNWDEVTEAVDGYKIRYRTGSNGQYDGVFVFDNTPTGASNNSILIASLTASTEYQWQVRAVCSSGLESAWSTDSLITDPQSRTVSTGKKPSVSKLISEDKAEENIRVEIEAQSINFALVNNDTDSNSKGYAIQIYDMNGILLYENANVMEPLFKISKTNNLLNRLIIIRVTNSQGIFTKKYYLE